MYSISELGSISVCVEEGQHIYCVGYSKQSKVGPKNIFPWKSSVNKVFI